MLNYMTNPPTYFGASAPSTGSFDIVFAKVIKITYRRRSLYGKMCAVGKMW